MFIHIVARRYLKESVIRVIQWHGKRVAVLTDSGLFDIQTDFDSSHAAKLDFYRIVEALTLPTQIEEALDTSSNRVVVCWVGEYIYSRDKIWWTVRQYGSRATG